MSLAWLPELGSGSAVQPRRLRPGWSVALALGALAWLAPRAASAHVKMMAPADWLVTDSLGDPQKVGPCGVDSTVTYTPSNIINVVHVGDQLTVNWTETVPHDGHFRISLAINSRDELTDPAITGGTMADPTAVAISTAYPVLADNLFPHEAANTPAGMTYSYTVTIPNTTCTKCTLQLLQFMANHPPDPSNFYHHCADMQILAAGADAGTGFVNDDGGSVTPDGGGATGGQTGAGGANTGAGGTTGTGSGGSSSAGATGTGGSGSTSSGCGCDAAGGRLAAAELGLGLGLLLWTFVRRARRARLVRRR